MIWIAALLNLAAIPAILSIPYYNHRDLSMAEALTAAVLSVFYTTIFIIISLIGWIIFLAATR